MKLSEVSRLTQLLSEAQEVIKHQKTELTGLLESKSQELEEILGSIDQIIWYIDIKTLSLQYVNNAIDSVFGFTKEDFLNNPALWQQRIHPDDRLLVRSFFETLHPGESQEIRFRIHRVNGELCWLNSRIYHNEKLELFVGITTDITESKLQSEEIAFLAYYDPLTMLANRAKLKRQLHSKLEHSPLVSFALIYIDLDNFKNINDTMGHEIGDQILIEVARRLRELTDHNHILSRFGGDEFVVLLNSADPLYISDFSTQLSLAFKTPFTINDVPFFMTSSFGIAIYPEDARNAEDLIKHADTAMHEAKKHGKNQVVYYHSSMQRAIHNFLYVESLIRDGLKHDLFELYFQPLVHAESLILQGFEALIRLPHPTEGFITPDTFISVAEKNGDILQIGQIVLEQACDFIVMVQQVREEPFYVAINVSAKQLHQVNFAQDLLDYLKLRSIHPHYLKVELTESAVMDNINIASRQLHLLREGDVHIALDDFGTGYSSFAFLAQLPISTLKIDKSFIDSVCEIDSHRHIVQAISNLAHILGMSVTAEGVETEDQFNFLVENHIDTLQGYLLSKPITKEEIIEKITALIPFFAPEKSFLYSI
ncbi:MAG: EAL domain-containing protein [Sulfuricurvum sp.]|jgi:diguanylate cyclase (GGDEF)-like protein/PAS domain S-box-containing protein